MNPTILAPSPEDASASGPSLENSIHSAISWVPPLWPLDRFVAVNPFVGFAPLPFAKAAAVLRRTTGTELSLPPSFYRERYIPGEITRSDLRQALEEAIGAAKSSGPAPTIGELTTAVHLEQWEESRKDRIPTVSEIHDEWQGTAWSSFFTDEISKWCVAYFDAGQALWKMPWKDRPLFAAWRQAASLDRNPEVAGLRIWRSSVSELEDDPIAEIRRAVERLGIPAAITAEVFHRMLMSVSGWAGHLQFLAHEKRLQGVEDDTLVHLLAVRLVTESVLLAAAPEPVQRQWHVRLAGVSAEDGDSAFESPLPSRIWQRAHECAMQRRLFCQLEAASGKAASAPPEVQAVFCIDVRSEVMRRAIEKVDAGVQTIGFAGFFGFPIESVPAGESHGSPQCPVLLKPAVVVPEPATPNRLARIRSHKRDAASWSAFKASAVSSFVFVETAGLGFGAKLVRDLTGRSGTSPEVGCGVDVTTIPLEKRIALAAGALRHLGFAGGGLARLVLFCGHGSRTANNPYGSSLDCGACGGHSGESNARAAVAVLNQPEVRAGLREQGIQIPGDTWFVAGFHNTTTDEVSLFDAQLVPDAHAEAMTRLKATLATAGELARNERAPGLGLESTAGNLFGQIDARSRDWSQVRPEWGLAGNYAFIAAPRERTRGLNLGGRVFLHDYNFAGDRDEATLELLLTAPVVVASWINLQYFASTVDNDRFGSGNKVLHNVAGTFGVFEGNGGDLRVGLPFQSVHDGKSWRHEPLRLAVCVEAPRTSIDRVLAKHSGVADLVANEWIHLFALGEDGRILGRSDGRGRWRAA